MSRYFTGNKNVSDNNNNNNTPSTAAATSASNMSAEKDAEIARLQQQLENLSSQLETAQQQQQQQNPNQQTSNNNDQSSPKSQKRRQMSPHAVHIQQVEAGRGRNERPFLRPQRERMGRNASISTQNAMQAWHVAEPVYNTNHPLATRVMEMFQQPSAHLDYLNSETFAKDLMKLASKVRHLLEAEPRVVYLQSPAYIFGDIHGNLEDLHFFSDNIWRLGMSLTAGNFLFLGDYVDRGMSCLEVTAYLFLMKLQLPHKVFLLRGNHETRDVNGWEEHYAERSFIYQCRDRFGDDVGYRIWEACNQVFDRMPLAGVVDQDIFCVHGGIPRPISKTGTRIQDILRVPNVAGINPPYVHEHDDLQQVASDCIWSDPASEHQEAQSVDPATGFGESLRGGGAICFGNKAVTDFLQQQGFSYIMRAHEAHAEGVAISKGARVFTVFSTSKDHNQGSQALAGCILVDGEKLQVINRSPAYKNQYVHRRDSVSLLTIPQSEINKRMKLGLVTNPDEQDSDEEWQDMESSDEEEEDTAADERYTFARNRRSSINLAQMTENMHDTRDVVQTGWEGYTTESSRAMFSSGELGGSTRVMNDTIREDDGDTSTVDGEAEMDQDK